MKVFDKAISIKPDIFSLWINKGLALVQLKKYPEALDAFSKATTLGGNVHEAWNYKGYVFEEMGKRQEALDAYDKAIQIKSDFLWH